jgi:Zn-dependent protease with chaperone function
MPTSPVAAQRDRGPGGGGSVMAAAITALGARIGSAVAGVALAGAIAGWALGGVVAAVILAVLGAVAAAGVAWLGLLAPRLAAAEDRVLGLVGPHRPADPGHEARVLNLVEGLAPAAGLSRPRTVVIDDPSANALAIGRDARHGVVVVTTGLLERLSRMELEAVVAHALVQLRDGTTVRPTVSLALGRLGAAAPDAGAGATAADLAAISLTRYPPGLSGALRRLIAARQGGAPDVPEASSPRLAQMWLVAPGDAGPAVTRIDALEEM